MMNESPEGLSTESLTELPIQGLFCLLRATPKIIKSPRLAATVGKAFITKDYSSDMFMTPKFVEVLSQMSMEKSEDVARFPQGVKIIIANHTSLTAILPPIASRMPKGEKMSYIFAEVMAPYTTIISKTEGYYERKVALNLMQLELTLPFVLATIPLDKADLAKEILRVAKVEGNIYPPISLLRKIREIHKFDSCPSFLIFIEKIASRGTNLHPPDPDLVHLSNVLLRQFQDAHLIFFAYNSQTHNAKSIEIARENLPVDLKGRPCPEESFYEKCLRQAMNQTISSL